LPRFRLGATGRGILLLSLTMLVSGCVVLPIPSPSQDHGYGRAVEKKEVEAITVGVTTRAELTNSLGGQFRESTRVPALAYAWELPAMGMAVLWGVASTHQAAGGVMDFERSKWRALFVRFNTNGVVTSRELVRLSGGKSLDDQLEKWAAQPSRSKP
jgi:hypothetical protein